MHFQKGRIWTLSVLERDERIHNSQRRLVSQIYSMETLKDFDDAVAHFGRQMQDRLGQNIDLGFFL